MKAMILAAGRGARLNELTVHTPKPLLLIGGKPLIAYHLINLAKIGVTDVVINVAYLAEKIMTVLGDGQQYGVNIQYSIEEEALETGGGIYKALPLLGAGPFLVLSGDIWTLYPLQQLPKKIDSLAHLVLVPNPHFHPTGDFCCKDGQLSSSGGEKFTFGNVGIYHPNLFAGCSAGHFRLGDLLFEKIKQGKVSGEVYNGPWFNVGTLEELNKLREFIIYQSSSLAKE